MAKIVSDSPLRARALELLVYTTPVQAASALGCDPSRISQFLAEEDFAVELSARRAAKLQKYNDHNNKLDSVEGKILERMEQTVNMGMVQKPLELTRMFAAINSAKRRGEEMSQPADAAQQKIVTLNLPPQIINNFIVNADNMVTRVGDQDLTTMDIRNVRQRAAAYREIANLQQVQHEEDQNNSTGRLKHNKAEA